MVVSKQPRSRSRNSTVAMPVSVGRTIGFGRGPSFGGTGGNLIVAHKEYFSDLVGSVDFETIALAVNPGMADLFPWLSAIANNWEKYRFRYLAFEYATFRPTTDTGTVVLTFDPDATDELPQNKSEVLSFKDQRRSNTYLPMRMVVSSSSLTKEFRYIRSEATPSTEDPRLNDVGLFNTSVEGQADTTAIGELTVHYIVELNTPQVSTTAALDSYKTGSDTGAIFGSGGAGTGPGPIQYTSDSSIFHKAGAWLVNLTANGVSGAAAEAPSTNLSDGVTMVLQTATSLLNSGGDVMSQAWKIYNNSITTGFGAAGGAVGGLGYSLAYPTSVTGTVNTVTTALSTKLQDTLTKYPPEGAHLPVHISTEPPGAIVLVPDKTRPVASRPGFYYPARAVFGADGWARAPKPPPPGEDGWSEVRALTR